MKLDDDEPTTYFDDLSTLDYPEGCWACGFPESDQYYGLTKEDAISEWKKYTTL